MMPRQVVVPASEGHRAFGKLLQRVFRSDEHLIVERGGYPVAVLLSYREYERLRQERAIAAFDQFSRGLGQEVQRQGLSEDRLAEEVRRAKREIYEEQYGSQT
jgi:prevent-host-death family protein